MRLYPLAIIPLVLSLGAIVVSAINPGPQSYLTVGVAGATFLVSAAILFAYSRKSTEAKQIPLENFSLWADVGEPAAELRRLGLDETFAAVQIVATDLDSLAANAELLRARTSLLVGRPGFESVTEEKMHRRVESLVNDIDKIARSIRDTKELTKEVIPKIEDCAAQADRIAGKFFELEEGKPETVYIYLEPLRRAAEKLSRDLRMAAVNISKYLLWLEKAPSEVPAPAPPAAPAVETPPAPQPTPAAPLKPEPQNVPNPELPTQNETGLQPPTDNK
ncbi:hypothetical protein [Candidatus Hadarchaeum sp.]|uniref:hypothetical protein n=1 Tax=Candidatus Hadarchaeum sp. TaxID=2883567 RepID=UPI003D125AE1